MVPQYLPVFAFVDVMVYLSVLFVLIVWGLCLCFMFMSVDVGFGWIAK